MRAFPATSAMVVRARSKADQVTVAPEAAPSLSTSASGLVRLAPVAAFQFRIGTTPAVSVRAIAVPRPTKSMPIVRPDAGVVTASAAVAACASVPLVPLIDRVAEPMGVPETVATVRVDDPPGLTHAGANTPLAPEGSPATASATGPEKPFTAPTDTV